MSEPIDITVTSNYIENAPDLQMRLFIRNLLDDYGRVSHRDKIALLRDEADRYELQAKETEGE